MKGFRAYLQEQPPIAELDGVIKIPELALVPNFHGAPIARFVLPDAHPAVLAALDTLAARGIPGLAVVFGVRLPRGLSPAFAAWRASRSSSRTAK